MGSGKGELLKPHIPLGHREQDENDGKPDVRKPRKAPQTDEKDPSLYYIFDENDNPLVIDLQAIDECQRLRKIPPFEAPTPDDGREAPDPAA